MYQECRHIKTSGTKCGAPALKGKAYCYFHFRSHRFRHRTGDRMDAFMRPKFQVSFLEDRGAIQAALSDTIHALAMDHMDHKRGGKILYGLHLALVCAKTPDEIIAPKPVRALCVNEDGEEIAPEEVFYEEDDEIPEELHVDEDDEQGDSDGNGGGTANQVAHRQDDQHKRDPEKVEADEPVVQAALQPPTGGKETCATVRVQRPQPHRHQRRIARRIRRQAEKEKSETLRELRREEANKALSPDP